MQINGEWLVRDGTTKKKTCNTHTHEAMIIDRCGATLVLFAVLTVQTFSCEPLLKQGGRVSRHVSLLFNYFFFG